MCNYCSGVYNVNKYIYVSLDNVYKEGIIYTAAVDSEIFN